MGVTILLVASVPAYLAAGLALGLGAGWGLALALFVGTGLPPRWDWRRWPRPAVRRSLVRGDAGAATGIVIAA